MGKLIGATFPIISERVGEGCATRGKDVKRIKQLLQLAKFLKNDRDGEDVWGKDAAKALMDFFTACQVGPVNAYIEPKDPYDRLFTLALTAGVLIPLPLGLRSISAVSILYEHCRTAGYRYGWKEPSGEIHNGGSRIIWGFANRPGWAISTVNVLGQQFFSSTIPVTLNCTSFANLMMSVWCQGNAHSTPYDASQMVGGYDPLGLRYNMHPIDDGKMIFDGYCVDLETLKQSAQKDRLYHFASCNNDGFITHDMVLLNGYVYECNKYKEPAVYRTELGKRFESMRQAGSYPRMLGPSPY